MADYGITHRILGNNSNGPRARTDWVVVHTQEGGSGDAIGLAHYCNGAGVSYNIEVDDQNTVLNVQVDEGPWAAANANNVAFHICLAGSYAAWGGGRWLSTDASDGLDENAMLWRAAKAAAAACQQFGVPVKKVGVTGYAAGNWPSERGVCGHVAFGAQGGGHYDPGTGFPWGVFVERVQSYLAPAPNLIDAEAKVAAGWIGKRLTTGETPLSKAGKKIGAFAAFENGHIYWRNGANAAYAIPHGGLFEAFTARGWEAGECGFPVLRHDVRDWGGVQSFQGGVLFAVKGGPEKGFLVHGEIGKRYMVMGWETGPLGLPTSDEQPVEGTDNIVQFFEHGDLRWSPTGVIVTLTNGVPA